MLAQLIPCYPRHRVTGNLIPWSQAKHLVCAFKGAITCAPIQLFQRKEGGGNSFDRVVEAIKLGISQAKEVLHPVGARRKLLLECQLKHDHEGSFEVRGYVHGFAV